MWEELKKEWREDPDPWWVKAIGYPLFIVLVGLLVFL
jgi:hypothetical protein